MPRWEPDAEQRLQKAAMELFTAASFETVTVEQITQRAGMSRRSFFRYFSDKREVIFPARTDLAGPVLAAIARAPKGSAIAATQAAFSALSVVGEFLLTDFEGQQRRHRVIQESPELRERERTKLDAAANAIGVELRARKVPQGMLLGAIATELFREAWHQTLEDNISSFAECFDATRRDATHLLAEISRDG